MRLSNQNKIVVGVIALILALTVGYAIFSETLNIGGTASASGEFSLIFSKKGEIKEVGSHGATADIINNNKTLDISVPALEYPSAYVVVPVTIKNAGSIDAILKGITTKGLTNDDITVTYSGIEKDEIIRVNEEKEMKIKVKWNESSTTSMSTLEDFNIELVYEQVTGENGGGGANPDLPVIEPIKLGDNVYANYNNGDIKITGTGPMWESITCEYQGNVMDNCSIAEEVMFQLDFLSILEPYILKTMEIVGQHREVTEEEQDNIMGRILYLSLGHSFEFYLGETKEEFKEHLMDTEENGGFVLSSKEAEEVITILETVPVIIKKVTIEEGITHIRTNSLSSIATETLRIPNSVTSVGDSILSSVEIGDLYFGKGLTTLSKSIFSGSHINNLIISEGVTKLESYSLNNILGLKTLTIPSTVMEIEINAIANCYDLETVVNKTGKSFDWNGILNDYNYSDAPFETGTALNRGNGKTITITK